MPTVSEIASFLDKKAPCSLKMDFDNVGLLCGFPDREVKTILVALDITQAVTEEAAGLGAELIVSHHPVIFSPLRRVVNDTPEGRRIIGLIRNGLSAICMHTNLDIIAGGVNTALCEAIDGIWEIDLREVGCVCRLVEPVPMGDFLPVVCERLRCGDMRFYDAGKTVNRIAICGGTGGDIIEEAAGLGCDTVLTSEIKHHQWIDGSEWGLNLIDAGHFYTEAPIVPVLASWLRSKYPTLSVHTSAAHRPLSSGFVI